MLENIKNNKIPFGTAGAGFGMQPESPAQNLPPMQGEKIDPEKLKQNIQDSYVASRLGQLEDINPIQQLGVAIPVWYGLAQSMDKFAQKCRGASYTDSVQYKMGAFGDRVSEGISNSSFGKSGFANWLKNSYNSATTSIKKFFNKSAVYRAFDKTPSKPELPIVLGQAGGMKGALLFDYPQIADNFMKPLKYAEDLDCYGGTADDIKRVKGLMQNVGGKGKAADAARRAILEAEEFRLLSPDKTDDAVKAFKSLDAGSRAFQLKQLKAKALGFADLETFEAVKKDIHSHLDDVINACKKVKPGVYSKIDVHDNSTLNKVWGHLFGRKVEFSEMANKLIGSKGVDNPYHKTKLGKLLPKYVNMFLEGATNRVAGGKLVAMMQAWFVAEAIIRTAQAEKGDKLRTFTERLTELVGFFMFMPAAIQLMHKLGGMQYAGMTPEAVAKYRQAVKEFNEKVASGFFIGNKKAYKAERKVLKEQLMAGTKNPFAKLCKKIGRIITVGLEQIRPYSKHAVEGGFKGRLKDVFRNPKYWLKQCAGYPMRIVLAMFMIMPFFNKLGIKVSHALFGKPKHSVLDDGKEQQPELTEAQQQELLKMLQEAQKQQQAVQQPFVSNNSPTNLLNQYKPKPVVNTSPTNLLNMYKAGTPYQTPLSTQTNSKQPGEIQAPGEPVRTYIPSPEPVKIVDNNAEPPRNYVPSSAPAQIMPENQDTTAADKALKRSEALEREALEMLSMRS